jgi:hypothetical protein
MPTLPAKTTGTMTALAAYNPVRNPQARTGHTPKPHARAANIEAYLGQIVSTINSPPCKHCKNGSGVWVLCVSVPGFFSGSCSNCHYNNEGIRCSQSRFFRPWIEIL